MEDNRRMRGEPDRSTVNLAETYEVTYWCRVWGISFATLQKAVAAVGKSVANVENWLRNNGHLRSV